MNKFVALAAALSTGFAGFAYAQTALSGADIQKTLKDKRVALACIDGTSGSGRYTMQKNSGTILGSYSKPGAAPVADVGQVRAQGNNLCLRFKLLNSGEEKCFDVSQTGPSRYSFSVSGVNACTLKVI